MSGKEALLFSLSPLDWGSGGPSEDGGREGETGIVCHVMVWVGPSRATQLENRHTQIMMRSQCRYIHSLRAGVVAQGLQALQGLWVHPGGALTLTLTLTLGIKQLHPNKLLEPPGIIV